MIRYVFLHATIYCDISTALVRLSTIYYDIRSTLHDLTQILYEFISISPPKSGAEVSVQTLDIQKHFYFLLGSNGYFIG